MPESLRTSTPEWEKPALRPVFTPDDQPEKWISECPDWCIEKDDGHFADAVETRWHTSEPLPVKVETNTGWQGPRGVMAAHLSLCLRKSDRSGVRRIRISDRWGDSEGRPQSTFIANLYPDEVLEFIAALQYLLKLAQEES